MHGIFSWHECKKIVSIHNWEVLKILIYNITSIFLFTFYPYFKDVLPQNEKISKSFLLLYSPGDLSIHNIHTLFGRLKQFFSCL